MKKGTHHLKETRKKIGETLRGCHIKTNHDREYWKNYLMKKNYENSIK